MTMTIDRIESFFVPPRWLFVRVETADGAVGWGEASLEGYAEAVDGALEALRDRFIGHDPRRIEDIWQIAYRGGFYRGGPVLMSALAGLEQALWDLKGKALGVPAWELLGGRVRDRVRAYAWIGGDRPDEIGEAAKARKEQGFSAVKMNATAELDWSDRACSTMRRPHGSSGAVGRNGCRATSRPGPSPDGQATRPNPRRSACFYRRAIVCRRIRRTEADRGDDQHANALGERLYSRWDFKPFSNPARSTSSPDLSHAGGILDFARIAAMAEAMTSPSRRIVRSDHCAGQCLQLAACARTSRFRKCPTGIL